MDTINSPEISDWERTVRNVGGYTPTAETQKRRDAEIARDEHSAWAQALRQRLADEIATI